jgi:2-methylcitrate dehydratase PrpD
VTATDSSVANVLGEWVSSFDLERDQARRALVERGKLHILDGVGVALAAAAVGGEYASIVRAHVERYGSAPQAQLIGGASRAAAPLAAFSNGVLIHGCEFDDTSHERIVHTESFVVPTVLAVGELTGSSGPELLAAWAVGTEVALRLARGLEDRHGLWRAGFHNSAVFGCFGAAAATARLLRLDAEATATALALCTSFASGTTAGWGEDTSRNKSLQPGWAARSGIEAALLAAEGYTCPHNTIDAVPGLYSAHAWEEKWSIDPVLEELGRTWILFDGTFKLHAAGAMMQATLDAVLQAVAENDVSPDEVDAVELVISAQYEPMVRRFKEVSYRPRSGYALAFSYPYAAACMILNRRVGPEHQTDTVLADERLRALVERIEYRADTDTSAAPEDQSTSVSIVTGRGTFTATQARHRGYPTDGIADRVLEKFVRNATLALGDEQADALREALVDLETVDIAALATLLVPPRATVAGAVVSAR